MVAIANDLNFGGAPANKTCRCAPVTLAHHVFLSSAEGAFDCLMTFDFGGVQRRISHVQGASNRHRCSDGSALFRAGRRRSTWRPRALRALECYAGAYGGSRSPWRSGCARSPRCGCTRSAWRCGCARCASHWRTVLWRRVVRSWPTFLWRSLVALWRGQLLEVVSHRLRLGLRLRNYPARDWRWQAKPEANAAFVGAPHFRWTDADSERDCRRRLLVRDAVVPASRKR